MDIYGIFKVVDLGETFGTNQYVFQAKYMVDANAAWKNKSNYFPKLINNPKTFEELNRLIYKKSLRKTTAECIDLPDLIEITHQLDFGKDQKKAYTELKRDYLTFVETSRQEGVSESVTANLAVTKALRMLQVASGFVQTDEGEVHEFKDVPKLDYAKELLEEIVVDGDNKCIVWCCFKHNYKMISRVCDELKIPHVFLTGEQSTTEKREAEQAFNNDPSVKVIIANRSAGGVGVNLKAASHSIIYSRNFSLIDELQSMARNYRGGSKDLHEKIIKIDLVTKESIELQVLESLRNKEDVSKKVIDIVKEN
jgi:SNF2 family DNA or RNA helicase